jgi:serine/threonine-protein kinase RsbT
MSELRIRHDIDVFVARKSVRHLASELRFSAAAAAELAIVASELCWNIIRHAGQGTLVVDAYDDPEHGVAIRLVACDSGPPIRDFELALRDGCDDTGPIDPATVLRRKGLGSGLGAVVRLTDRCTYRDEPGGKLVEVLRFRRRSRRRRRGARSSRPARR